MANDFQGSSHCLKAMGFSLQQAKAGGASASFSDMKKLAPKAKIMPGLESYENTAKDRDVTEWIRKNMK